VRIVANEVKKLTKDPAFAYKAPMMQKSNMKCPETQRKALGRCSLKRVGLKQASEKVPFFYKFPMAKRVFKNVKHCSKFCSVSGGYVIKQNNILFVKQNNILFECLSYNGTKSISFLLK
jgi:hypothetical protein